MPRLPSTVPGRGRFPSPRTGDLRRPDRTYGAVVQVTFLKVGDGRLCRWDAVRGKRIRVPGPTMAAGRGLPHDLATFVVEAELGLHSGFWGCVAAGATFRSLPRRRTEQGTQVIREHVADLDRAEAAVNAEVRAWERGERPAAAPALDAMLARWRALRPDEGLVVDWSAGVAPRRSGRRRRRR